MAYQINKECIACGTCEHECPVQAISGGKIDPEKCAGCGLCATVCPVQAIRDE